MLGAEAGAAPRDFGLNGGVDVHVHEGGERTTSPSVLRRAQISIKTLSDRTGPRAADGMDVRMNVQCMHLRLAVDDAGVSTSSRAHASPSVRRRAVAHSSDVRRADASSCSAERTQHRCASYSSS